MKLVFTLFAFFITLHLTAQAIEKYYPNGVLQQQGKYKAYSKKSTYGYAVITLKTGVWTHYYENEQIALKEEYKVRWKKSKPIGIWEYYTVDGDLLKKEYYKNGRLKGQEYFSEGLYNYTTDSFKTKSIATDTMLVTYFLKGHSFGELVVNDGTGVYTYFTKTKIIVKETVDLLVDTGFVLPNPEMNLIGNHSFERSKYRGNMNYEVKNMADTVVYNWYAAAGTPDYFKSSFVGGRTGIRYCGIRLYSNIEYLEYLENKLKQPLVAGQKYCCKVFFKLNYKSGLATDAIGFKFSTELLKFHYNSNFLPIPDIINKPRQMLTKTKEWMQLTGLYTAVGGEEFFIIGGFKTMGATNKTIVDYKGKEEAYYFIDDAYIWKVANDSQCICNTITVPDSLKQHPLKPIVKIDTATYKVGKTFVIKNIFFDTDKALLLPQSSTALDSLVALLFNYPTMTIEVSGHTDNVGTKERNTVLSKERAQAVVNYLKRYGIKENRLKFAGYAATQPMDTNKTSKGRQNNRRVQFKILKM